MTHCFPRRSVAMTLERTACVAVSLVFTCSLAAGQSPAGGISQCPTTTVIERTYDGGITPWRVVSTRTMSGEREVAVETVESPDLDGRMSPIQEPVTDRARTTPAAAQTNREIFV